jgi:hypothetical protein
MEYKKLMWKTFIWIMIWLVIGFSFGSVFFGLLKIDWYRWLDNSSIAGILTVLIGGIISVGTFWQQRRQTKIESLLGDIELLIEKCEQVNLILDRISCTYLKIKDPEQKSLFFDGLKDELPVLAKIVNDEIPKIRARVKNYIGFYFSQKNYVVDAMTSFFVELKSWHDNVGDIAFLGYDFDKRISDNPKFDLEKTKDGAKNLKEIISKHFFSVLYRRYIKL